MLSEENFSKIQGNKMLFHPHMSAREDEKNKEPVLTLQIVTPHFLHVE